MTILKEACVGNFSEAKRAYELGADRIELCDNLKEGGTTPSFATIEMVRKSIPIPIFVIIRPRGGNFIFKEDEIKIMERDIEICKSLGIDGVVIGALTHDNNIDENTIKRLTEKANGMDVTFHMAFDLIDDKKAALDKLIELGIHRVLTKGGLDSAINNLYDLRILVQYVGDKIIILPGGGIAKHNYIDVVNMTGAKEVHGTKIVGSLT